MNDEGDVAVHVSGKLAECADERVLLGKAVRIFPSGAHHELEVVHHYVGNVVNIYCMGHGLEETKTLIQFSSPCYRHAWESPHVLYFISRMCLQCSFCTTANPSTDLSVC